MSQHPPKSVQQLVRQLASPRPMRRGSLGERLIKCGKPNCACATDPQARHGPYFSLTRSSAKHGTRSRRLSAAQADRARQQLTAGQAFRAWLEAYWQACEQWADAELDEAAAEGGKKGGLSTSSAKKSSANSKPS